MFTEEGLFLALDLGGTNFRVILLELVNGVVVREDVKMYHIGSHLRMGSGIPLYDYLAECVSNFVISEGLQDVELPLGKLDCVAFFVYTHIFVYYKGYLCNIVVVEFRLYASVAVD